MNPIHAEPFVLGYIRTSTPSQSDNFQLDMHHALMTVPHDQFLHELNVSGETPPYSRLHLLSALSEIGGEFKGCSVIIRPLHLDRYFKARSHESVILTYRWQKRYDIQVRPYVPIPQLPKSLKTRDLSAWVLRLCKERMVSLGNWKSVDRVPVSLRGHDVLAVIGSAVNDIRVLAKHPLARDPEFRRFAFACRAYGCFNPLLRIARARMEFRDRDSSGWGKEAAHYGVFEAVSAWKHDDCTQVEILSKLQAAGLSTSWGKPFLNRDALRTLLRSEGYRAYASPLPPLGSPPRHERPHLPSGLYEVQQRALKVLATGSNVLLVSATGSGKTEVALRHHRRLLGFSSDHLTVFVAPYTSLVRFLQRRYGGMSLTGPMSEARNQRKLRRIQRGTEGGLLFLTPDKLTGHAYSAELSGAIRARSSVLLVVDECDCALTEAEFRQAYRNIRVGIGSIEPDQTLCMTATAPQGFVRQYLERKLLLSGNTWKIVEGDLDRPNLAFDHLSVANINAKRATVVQLLWRHLGLGHRVLVIDSKIKYVDRLYELLKGLGIRVGRHHSERPLSERDATLKGLAAGDLDVVVCTSGFGRGLDLALDAVIVNHVPPSQSQLRQFFGRCARDGRPGWCWWVTCPDDQNFLRYAKSQVACAPIAPAAREYLVSEVDVIWKAAESSPSSSSLRDMVFQQPPVTDQVLAA